MTAYVNEKWTFKLDGVLIIDHLEEEKVRVAITLRV